MKKLYVLVAVCFLGILFISFTNDAGEIRVAKTPQDSLAAEREKFIAVLLDSLKDKKNVAADSVFVNLKVFTSSERIPVRHFLAIMDYWGEALHVSCTYCHSPSAWSSDAMRTKRIARDMYRMRQTINGQILPAIDEIDHKRAEVNCGTCHNGKAVPQG